MGRTRSFGNIKYRPSKANPKRIVASFATPEHAFEMWPALPERQSKSFPGNAEDDALTWLSSQRKFIEAGVWKLLFTQTKGLHRYTRVKIHLFSAAIFGEESPLSLAKASSWVFRC